jgi:hypothetical protein
MLGDTERFLSQICVHELLFLFFPTSYICLCNNESSYCIASTEEFSHKNLGLCDTSSITLHILQYQLIPHETHIFLVCLVQTR